MASNLLKTLEDWRHLAMQLFQYQELFPTNQAAFSFEVKHSEKFPAKLYFQLEIRKVEIVTLN